VSQNNQPPTTTKMKNIIITLATLFAAFTTSFATTVTGSSAATSYQQQGRKTVDNTITVTGGAHINGNTASVSITGFIAGDTLIVTDKQGLGNYHYNATTGVLTFSGNASAAEWQIIFRSVMFNRSNNNSSARTVNFGLDGASYNKMVTNPNALALTWVSFSGNASGSNVMLNWATADEKNTASFAIERSADGKSFEQIGSLKTVGSGNNSYDFTDAAAANGNNYYRLKQIDNDGTYQYSKVITVAVRKETAQVSIFPNPAKDVLNVKSNTPVSVAIYNMNGALVAAQDATTDAAVNISSLPEGFYVYRLTSGNEVVQTGKVQVIK
jgi:hypothetical protein